MIIWGRGISFERVVRHSLANYFSSSSCFIEMPIQRIKRDIKRHRPIDWFAIVVLVSVAFVIIAFLGNKVDEFNEYMDAMSKNIAK